MNGTGRSSVLLVIAITVIMITALALGSVFGRGEPERIALVASVITAILAPALTSLLTMLKVESVEAKTNNVKEQVTDINHRLEPDARKSFMREAVKEEMEERERMHGIYNPGNHPRQPGGEA